MDVVFCRPDVFQQRLKLAFSVHKKPDLVFVRVYSVSIHLQIVDHAGADNTAVRGVVIGDVEMLGQFIVIGGVSGRFEGIFFLLFPGRETVSKNHVGDYSSYRGENEHKHPGDYSTSYSS